MAPWTQRFTPTKGSTVFAARVAARRSDGRTEAQRLLRPNCRVRRKINESVNQAAATEFGRESGVPFNEAHVKCVFCATCFTFISPVYTKSCDQ